MAYVTYTGSGSAIRLAEYDLSVARGETVSVDDDTAAALADRDDFEQPSADESAEATTGESAESSDTEAEEPEPAPEAPEPLDGTVPEIEDALATGKYDDDLVDLYNAERGHENRSTAIEAIQDRRDTLREQNTSESDEE